MVGLALPPSSCPEKHQVAFAELAAAYPLAVALQHILCRTGKLLPIHLTVNRHHKTGAVHPALRQPAHPVRHSKPMRPGIVQIDIVLRRQTDTIQARKFLGPLEISRKNHLRLLSRTTGTQQACQHHDKQETQVSARHLYPPSIFDKIPYGEARKRVMHEMQPVSAKRDSSPSSQETPVPP